MDAAVRAVLRVAVDGGGVEQRFGRDAAAVQAGAARLAPRGGRAAHGDARVGIPVLRRAEPAAAHRAALVALRHRRGGDALDLVRAADARAAHPHLLPPDGGRRRGRCVRLPHLHRPERRRMVPRPRPAHPRLGVRAGVPFELSAARRAAVAALRDRHVHRHRGADGAGCGILHGPLFPRGVAADVVARRGGHLRRAHHPAARRAPRALTARGGPPTLQYVKKGGHGARHAFPFLVPVVGLEPTRCRHRRILNPLRLPFHHTGTFYRETPKILIGENKERTHYKSHILL